MALKFKPGVSIIGAKAELVLVLNVATGIFDEYGFDLVVTSLTDDDEDRVFNSRHKIGMAADLRRPDLWHPREWEERGYSVEDLGHALRKGLPGTSVLIESNHYHLQIEG